jgi:hypothetical protein
MEETKLDQHMEAGSHRYKLQRFEDARVAQWQGLAVASLPTRVRLPTGTNLGCSHQGSYPSSLSRSFAPVLESGKGRSIITL